MKDKLEIIFKMNIFDCLLAKKSISKRIYLKQHEKILIKF